jgi:UDP-N-acetylmuramyl pentapeptide phosphotransferase/UDP-N-acetylglucosamine-1-phosphate transferase
MPTSAIIPAYRAADTIAQTVRAVRSLPDVVEIVVVDDGSGDGTAEAARAAGADEVILFSANEGKGAALRRGAAAASADQLLFLDADLGSSAAHAGPLLAAAGGDAAMVVGVLPARPGSGGLGLAKGLARATIRLLAGIDPAAPMSGQRALPASLVEHIGLAPRFAVEVGLTAEAAHLGLTIREVQVPLEHAPTGRTVSGFAHRARQFQDILGFLLLTGYGLGWPALSAAATATRIALLLTAVVGLLALTTAAAPSATPAVGAAAAGGIVLWLPCLWVTSVWLGLRKTNYLGRSMPAAAGLLFVAVGLPALLLSSLEPPALRAGLIVVGAFGVLGLLDDLLARGRQARGLRGHLSALARGRLTTGTVKALGGLAAGAWAGAVLHPGQPGLIALDALLIALCANFVNLLDLRPGRALKGFALLAVIAVAVSVDSLHLLGPLLAAAAVAAPSDLAGRTMMGDVGSNVLGGTAGLALALCLGPTYRLVAVVILAIIHLACERYSLSDIIERRPTLRALDQLGAEHLPPLPESGKEAAG